MDIGGNKLKAVQSRLDMINGRIDQTTALKNKANVAVKTAKRYNFMNSVLYSCHVLNGFCVCSYHNSQIVGAGE